MDYFKKIMLIVLFSSNTLFAFSLQPKVINKNDFATILQLDNRVLEICQLKKSICKQGNKK